MALTPGATHVLQWAGQRGATLRGGANLETGSQFGLESQLDFMKVESLVIADQHAAVNTFPGLVHTARHTTKVDDTRSCWVNP